MAAEDTTRYITRYALTRGIIKAKGTFGLGSQVFFWWEKGRVGVQTAYAKDHYATLEEAIERADFMRKKAIAACRRRIKKLQEMEFGEPNGNQ